MTIWTDENQVGKTFHRVLFAQVQTRQNIIAVIDYLA